MTASTLQTIYSQYQETQSLILHVVESLEPEEWGYRFMTTGTPISFHVWHIAREADVLASMIRTAAGKPSQQIWERDRLASKWGLQPESLGVLQTGLGMEESSASRAPWPDGETIRDYLQRAFDEVNDAIATLDSHPGELSPLPSEAVIFGGASTVDGALMSAIANGNRHLGIIGWLSNSKLAVRNEPAPGVILGKSPARGDSMVSPADC